MPIMNLKLVSVLCLVALLYYIFLCYHARVPYSIDDAAAAINCGSVSTSTALDGREWIGEAASKMLSGKSRSSTVAAKSFSADPVPYKTSRISSTEFSYNFEVSPGQKFIRLHFYPASYRELKFRDSVDFFTVKADAYTLLRDFSPSVTAETLGVQYVVKEFCLNVDQERKLNITFLPSTITKFDLKTHAFVNGIEIVPMPTGLYYTPDGDLGARVVGHINRYNIDNNTALEATHRLNIGGSIISPVEDFGMFRRWTEDTNYFNYLLESRVVGVNHQALWIKYAHIAPLKLYLTSWKAGSNIRPNQMYNFTWKMPVELGFGYLVRLHFCELNDVMAESERDFSVLINNHIVETQADFRLGARNRIPMYRDYMVQMKGDKGGIKTDLLIVLQSVNASVIGLLNGLEILKLSNFENSLATPTSTFPKTVMASWNLGIPKFLVFTETDLDMSVCAIIIGFIFALVQDSRKKFHQEATQAAKTKRSFRCFSLVELTSATKNFSEECVIGRGGFGTVYRGFVDSISADVAIKRLKSGSRQGAREFQTEIEILSDIRHINVVSLLGYCDEEQEMILVYEYMPSGTLAENIYGGRNIQPLSWSQRLCICIGAARGLEYLHSSSELAVIHRDVNASNILLDKNFVAKISDTGLAKCGKITESKSYISTAVKGTTGFFDPENFQSQRLTTKSDVYSFGVVLLVVLLGKPAVDNSKPEDGKYIVEYFREHERRGEIDRIVDPNLHGEICDSSLNEFLHCVENCLHMEHRKRFTMIQVIASLECALGQRVSGVPSLEEESGTPPSEEESGMRSLEVEITSETSQNPCMQTRGADLQEMTDYDPVPTRSRNWPLMAVWKKLQQKKGVSVEPPHTGDCVDASSKSVLNVKVAGETSKGTPLLIEGKPDDMVADVKKKTETIQGSDLPKKKNSQFKCLPYCSPAPYSSGEGSQGFDHVGQK